MKRLGLLAVVFALGFLSAWESSSRYWLRRIPQWDDVAFAIATGDATVAPPRPRVLSPLGGTSAIGSIQIWPDDTSVITTRLAFDGITCTTSAIYTYDAKGSTWWVWTPMRLYRVGAR